MFENTFPHPDVLSEEAVATIDGGWKRLVSEIGVEFLHPEALERFRQAGQKVVGDVVYLDPAFVEQQIAKAPAEFVLRARNPAQSLRIGGDVMTFMPVYGAPFVLHEGTRRDASLADFERLVRLSQHFDEIDSPGGVVCEPADRPLDSRHLDMLQALITLADKPFFASVISRAAAEDSVGMAEIVFGGRAAIEEHPVMLAIINANSPLRYDDRMLEAMIVLSEARQPVIVTPAVIMGAMAPVSLPAALAQSLAEAFAAIALIQLIRPGCPTVMGEFVTATDMKSGSPGFGGPEVALGLLCAGQLARHYGLPWRAGAGAITTSQVVDAQAGYESMQVQSAAFLAGAHVVVHSAGALDALLVASCEKFILDIEILRTLRAQYTVPAFDEASLAFDAHLEVGHGGHFFGAEHTLARFRDCFHRPWLATTANHTRWVREGSLSTSDRAAALWPAALEAYDQPQLDDAVREQLSEFVTRRRHELGDA